MESVRPVPWPSTVFGPYFTLTDCRSIRDEPRVLVVEEETEVDAEAEEQLLEG
jgi:hypothetical protein